ncbi:MAG: endolytic transglycosylase MltG [Oscillospiraceae bacterium]|nr:endolytic transglycosylase MltG [Oscillospiraceae bacterium]
MNNQNNQSNRISQTNQNNNTNNNSNNVQPNQNKNTSVNNNNMPQRRPAPANPNNAGNNRVNRPSDKTPRLPDSSSMQNRSNSLNSSKRPTGSNINNNRDVNNVAKNANMANMAADNLEDLRNFQTQKERTQVFDSMTNEKGINTSRLSDIRDMNGGNDGSYHYTGKNIRSNRQKLTDVSPEARKTRKPDYDHYDDEMTVSNKSKARGKNKDNAADSKSGGFIMSGIVKAILYIAGVILVSVIIAYNIISVANDVFAFVKTPVSISVTIPENATIEDISKILYDHKLIKYPSIFNFYSHYREKNNDWQFVAGTYPVSSDMNYDELAAEFMKSDNNLQTIRIMIPEGYTVDQIIDLFVGKGMGSRDKYVDIINNEKTTLEQYKFVKMLDDQTAANPDRYKDRKYRLEGYLFPDTYEFYTTDSELTIITKLLDNFDKQFSDDFYTRCDNIGMTVDEVVTLASMIEKEAKHPEDFPKISAVFHNRLSHSANFPTLDSDATIQYSLPAHNDDLTQADLQQNLPYNTYVNPGLPPSAICNPGYEAISDALFPEDNFTDYYYFVANINTGNVYYAKTLAEQNANKITAQSDNAPTTEEN